MNNKFLPVTKDEIDRLGWDRPDVILVSGDTYIDSPYNGTALVGRLLESKGFKVAIIAQPDMESDEIASLGEPRLFWGVSAGCVDSMVANYTASKKPRKSDDFTPGGENNRRPDRAVIAYSNLIRRHFKATKPIVIGGIEASLRRITHYDFWSNKLRRSVLFDAKADYLIYGMGEEAVVAIANALDSGESVEGIRGICYSSVEKPDSYEELPPYKDCVADKNVFTEMFHTFYKNNDPITAKGLVQLQDTRYLVQNPPTERPIQSELNSFYELPYTYQVHPHYAQHGKVKAIDTIRNSVTTHRGCYGECNFCAIAVHQGTTIVQRSEKSILNEVKTYASADGFNGVINDIGGPTANMYGMECRKKLDKGRCDDKRCLFPERCPSMPADHKRLTDLLDNIKRIKNIKRVFVASGIRYDLIMDDRKSGDKYLKNIVENHVSGQMKIAPEHSEQNVLNAMGKPKADTLKKFVNKFYSESEKSGKKQFLTYYMIAAHPGCKNSDMENLKSFASRDLRINPEQVQIFTPTPSTYSTLMYYTGKDPFTGEDIFVEKDPQKRVKQKEILAGNRSGRASAKPKNNHRPKPKSRPKPKCCALSKPKKRR